MRIPLAVGVFGLAVCVLAGCRGAEEPATEPMPEAAVTSHATVEVKWEDDWDDAFERARNEGKPVLANFYADWCVWCKHLETITFRDAKVASLLSSRVVPVGVDVDGTEPSMLEDQRIQAPPTIVVYDPEGAELGRIPGYMPPTGFLRSVEKIIGKDVAPPIAPGA